MKAKVDELRREVLRRLTVMETHDKRYTLADAQREARDGKKLDRMPTQWVPLAALLADFEDAVRQDEREEPGGYRIGGG